MLGRSKSKIVMIAQSVEINLISLGGPVSLSLRARDPLETTTGTRGRVGGGSGCPAWGQFSPLFHSNETLPNSKLTPATDRHNFPALCLFSSVSLPQEPITKSFEIVSDESVVLLKALCSFQPPRGKTFPLELCLQTIWNLR